MGREVASAAGGFSFQILAGDSAARVGVIATPHGEIPTPAFVPVGTQATVKALAPDDLRAVGCSLILANTYHLHLRPGAETVRDLGGLHRFMGWDGPIMTDSGGFQAFSLGFGIEHGVGKIASIFPGEEAACESPSGHVRRGERRKLATVDEDGVTFVSHLDGSRQRLTPETSIKVQEMLGADIILAFDECTSPLHDHEYTRLALGRTHRWALRCLAAHSTGQAMYGIVQGGAYRDLREESARFVGGLPFAGFAVGGSLGRSKEDMHRVLEWTVPLLPEERPRHLLGIGDVDDIFAAVGRGIDTFDCVGPTRLARNGVLLVGPEAGGTPANRFRLNIKNAAFARDERPVDHRCRCYTCRSFSRAYLRHLFRVGELLAYRLASIHNVAFMMDLMARIREAIAAGRLRELRREWLGSGVARCGTGSIAGSE